MQNILQDQDGEEKMDTDNELVRRVREEITVEWKFFEKLLAAYHDFCRYNSSTYNFTVKQKKQFEKNAAFFERRMRLFLFEKGQTRLNRGGFFEKWFIKKTSESKKVLLTDFFKKRNKISNEEFISVIRADELFFDPAEKGFDYREHDWLIPDQK